MRNIIVASLPILWNNLRIQSLYVIILDLASCVVSMRETEYYQNCIIKNLTYISLEYSGSGVVVVLLVVLFVVGVVVLFVVVGGVLVVVRDLVVGGVGGDLVFVGGGGDLVVGEVLIGDGVDVEKCV